MRAEKAPAVYILASKRRGTLYLGVTSDLVQRIWQHRESLVEGFTTRYGVRTLVWYEQHPTMLGAIAREKAMKKWLRTWKIALIERTNPDWRDLWADVVDTTPTPVVPAHAGSQAADAPALADAAVIPPDAAVIPAHTAVVPAHTAVVPAHTAVVPAHTAVIPAHAGIHSAGPNVDSRVRGNDGPHTPGHPSRRATMDSRVRGNDGRGGGAVR